MQTIYWNLHADADSDNKAEVLQAAGRLLRQGEVVAFPTETVYGLGADGLNGAAVAKIFAAKGRPADNPLILHIARKEDILPLTSGLTANARALMEAFWPGPLTLIVDKSQLIPDEVSAGLATVGVRMPSHPVAAGLIAATGRPIAAPSANISGKPSPTDAQAVWDDMQGKIAGIIDGGSCGIGVESTVVDTTAAVPMILRPGGITREMLEAVLGAVEVDPALGGQGDFKPKAPGMKYRHYAPQAAMYLFEGEAAMQIPAVAAKAAAQGIRTGVLCSEKIAAQLPQAENMLVSAWGQDTQALAEKLYSLLRGFDKQQAELIVAEGVGEDGLGLAVMNRLRKAAGYQIVTVSDGRLCAKSGTLLTEFMLK